MIFFFAGFSRRRADALSRVIRASQKVGVRAVSAFALAPFRFALCAGVAHGY
jgi:hypothetical protein